MTVHDLPSRGEIILTKTQLAAHLKCSTRTIENRTREGMPKLGLDRFGKRQYRLSDVEAWMASGQRAKPVDRLSRLEARVQDLEARVAELEASRGA